MLDDGDSSLPGKIGRPKGARNLRSRALGERLAQEGKDPAEALARIAETAEQSGDFTLAADAWKALLPYVHARLKPIESDPEAVVELARRVKQVEEPEDATFAQRLKEACEKLDRLAPVSLPTTPLRPLP